MNKEQVKKVLGTVKIWMDRILSVACAILLSFMTFLVLWQVFTRYILNHPAAFTEELVKYSLIWTGFIGAAYAFSTREHMSLTIVRDKLTGVPHKILMIAIDVLILALAVMVIPSADSSLRFLRKWSSQHFLESREVLSIPVHRCPEYLLFSHS